MASPDATTLLRAWNEGDLAARDQLIAALYTDLHRRASGYLRKERRNQTLQPTALVHEAYLRLVKQERMVWQNRAQFLAVGAQMMRRILVDRARAHNMRKRSGQWAQITLDEQVAWAPQTAVDLLDLDRALARLAEFDPRKSHVAELRFFGGLSLEETGHALNISVATVEREWQVARAWLHTALTGRPTS